MKVDDESYLEIIIKIRGFEGSGLMREYFDILLGTCT
jgi:hypothetical protein